MFKLASVGSVSHATLKSDDLVAAFYNELEWQLQRQERTPENCEELDKLHNVLGECGDECWDDDGNVIDDEDVLSEYVNEALPNALNCFSPPYTYFGAHCGDGSDFGYWPSCDAIDELPSYEDTDEAIADECRPRHRGRGIVPIVSSS